MLGFFSAENRPKINLYIETLLFFVIITLLHDHRWSEHITKVLIIFIQHDVGLKNVSTAKVLKKPCFYHVYSYYYSWRFSSIISSLHIASGPIWDHFKCFEFAAERISSLGVLLRERMATIVFSLSPKLFRFEYLKVLQLLFSCYRSDAFLRSVWNAVTFLGSSCSKPAVNSSCTYVFAFLNHFWDSGYDCWKLVKNMQELKNRNDTIPGMIFHTLGRRHNTRKH